MEQEIDLTSEIERLREKAHDHANMLLDHEGRLLEVEEDVSTIEKTLIVLNEQSKVLKWLLGVASAILVSIITNAL